MNFGLHLNAFLLAFVAIGYNQCLATYLKYQIGSEFGSNYEIKVKNVLAIDTSIILESSELMPKSCFVRISTATEVDGLMVSVRNLKTTAYDKNDCNNSIQFNSLPPIQWCDLLDTKTLIFEESTLDMAFNSISNNSLPFELVVTPFEKPVSGQKCATSTPFSCQTSTPLQCISSAFHCDGLSNCPNGTDEHNCVTTSKPEIINQKPRLEEQLPEDSGYTNYNILDFCNRTEVIRLKWSANDGISPAILQLNATDSKRLNQTDCLVRFEIGPSKFYSTKKGLVVGIDQISLASDNNRTCDDFIQISNSGKQLTKWCEDKSDGKGISFSGKDSIDILFHAGSDSNSSFSLIITPFTAPVVKWCPSGSELKCTGSSNECVSKQFKCDYHRNCPNGEDEDNCQDMPTTSTTTPNTTTTTTTPNTTTTTTTTPVTTTTKTTTTEPTTTTSSTTTSKSTTTSRPTPEPHMKPGIIVLIVIGTLIGVALLLGAIIFYCRRRGNNPGYNALN